MKKLTVIVFLTIFGLGSLSGIAYADKDNHDKMKHDKGSDKMNHDKMKHDKGDDKDHHGKDGKEHGEGHDKNHHGKDSKDKKK